MCVCVVLDVCLGCVLESWYVRVCWFVSCLCVFASMVVCLVACLFVSFLVFVFAC